jgi:Protein of unknown function (DUF742)
MASSDEESWIDGDTGRLVRPYAVSDGRTHPTSDLDLLTMVRATGSLARIAMDPDREQALALCSSPISVAEIAARLKLPALVTKILVSDLLEGGAVTVRTPPTELAQPDHSMLKAVLDGLHRRL